MKLLLASLLTILSLNSMAVCDFVLNTQNNTGKKITVRNVKYKLPKTVAPTWEKLNFGADLDIANGKESYPTNRKIGRWGFKVTNLVVDCKEKVKWRFEYKCSGGSWKGVSSGKRRNKKPNGNLTVFYANITDCNGTTSWD